MVYYSTTATADFKLILLGLITWKKHQLSYEHALSYVDNIHAVCESLPKKTKHQLTSFEVHKEFGKYVHAYNRNKSTTWYIIYNVTATNDFWIEKIISNHLTVK